MGRRTGYLIAAGIVIGAFAVAAIMVSLAPQPERREPPSQFPYVETAEIIAGTDFIPVYGAGTVRPSAEIDLAPQVGGRIVWVAPGFRSGGRVDRGQLLFRIEEADYQHRVRDAEAALAARQVALLEARGNVVIARAEYERFAARKDQNVDEMRAPANPLALREPQLDAAEAALKREEAQLAAAQLDLSRTRVSAPFDGFVREESVDIGQLVVPGESVGRLFAADAAEVVVPLSDAEAALIPGLWALSAAASGREAKDQRVAARVIADYGGDRYAWPGHVDRAERSLDERTRTIEVIVRVPEPFAAGEPVDVDYRAEAHAPPLLVGKFAEVVIEGASPTNYVRVPRDALQPGDEVWTVGEAGAVRIVRARVLQRGNDEVFVTGAFEPRSLVIISGLQVATDGMTVRSAAQDAAAAPSSRP
ncbi:MAG: efflux RND transporter periplasmic adaptor subunit [Gammaproteobacteria bacterium]|nr:efflux RND transporter periplasmic adaptor subunit [Gammaproteobacteria bacterium]